MIVRLLPIGMDASGGGIVTWRRALAAVGTFCGLLQGCGRLFEEGCTLIGCTSGLRIQLVPPPSSYRLEARSIPAGSPVPLVVECAAPAGCGTAFFDDYFPTRVQLRLIVAGRTRDTTLTPTYVVSRPNGDHCEPTCRQAAITLPVP